MYQDPILFQADCNILHKVELEGSGVNMQDESTLLNQIEEHERVLEDVHQWIELKYVLKYAEHIEGKETVALKMFENGN